MDECRNNLKQKPAPTAEGGDLSKSPLTKSAKSLYPSKNVPIVQGLASSPQP